MPDGDYTACLSCEHGGKVWPPPCFINRAVGAVGNLLTSIDTGADGHMASGQADLRCNGYTEAKPEPISETAEAGAVETDVDQQPGAATEEKPAAEQVEKPAEEKATFGAPV